MIFLQDVPRSYAYCFASKDTCPKATTCLRAIATTLLAESKEKQPQTLSTVNEWFIKQLPDLNDCPLYRSSEPLRHARGMTRLFDEVPMKKMSTVRPRVVACFSSERYFYFARNGSRLITVEEQRKVARVFRSAGLDFAPQFDSYEYAIEW